VRIVRGAPTHIAGLPVGKVLHPEGEPLCSRCRRARVAFLCRKRSSIKCLAKGQRSICPAASVTCAGWSSKPPLEPPCCPKGTRALRRCTCGGIIVPPLFGQALRLGSFGVKVVPRMMPIARRCSRLRWGRRLTSRCSEPPNHKVLGRGRGLANLIAITPRPRADTSARGR
jgi:hypothetical protein